jgi:hypothetical protein
MKDFDDLDAGTTAGSAGTSNPENMSSVDYLRSVYRNPLQPTPVRMKAAIEAAPYEAPRLSVTASAEYVGFGDAPDAAIARARARQPKLSDGSPANGVPSTEPDAPKKD